MDQAKAVEREYDAVSHAVAHHRRGIDEGILSLPRGTSARDLDSAAVHLEPTYLIRLWAVFETALRSYRRDIAGNLDDRIGTENPIDWTAGIKQGRASSEEVRDDVHDVREYRNGLVHERDDPDPPEPVAIHAARRRLDTFLQKLPERW